MEREKPLAGSLELRREREKERVLVREESKQYC